MKENKQSKEAKDTQRNHRQIIGEQFRKRIERDDTKDFSRETIRSLLEILTDRLQLEDVTDDEVSDLFRQLDINGNGKLSKDEIKVFTKQLIDIVANYTMPQKNEKKSAAGSRE